MNELFETIPAHLTFLALAALAVLWIVSSWRQTQRNKAEMLSRGVVLAAVRRRKDGKPEAYGNFTRNCVKNNETHDIPHGTTVVVFMYLSMPPTFSGISSGRIHTEKGVYKITLTGRGGYGPKALPAQIRVLSHIKNSHLLSSDLWLGTRPQRLLYALLEGDETLPGGDPSRYTLSYDSPKVFYHRKTGVNVQE